MCQRVTDGWSDSDKCDRYGLKEGCDRHGHGQRVMPRRWRMKGVSTAVKRPFTVSPSDENAP